MNRLERVLGGALEILAEAGSESAVVGGLAVSVRTEPRITRDVGLVVGCRGTRQWCK